MGYIRVVIKEKLLQLKLSREVEIMKARVQRSKMTGWLRVEMPLAESENGFIWKKHQAAKNAAELEKELGKEVEPLKPEDEKAFPEVAADSKTDAESHKAAMKKKLIEEMYN